MTALMWPLLAMALVTGEMEMSRVEAWREVVREERASLQLRESDYPDHVMLALIHVESAGRADARDPKRPQGQFWGLLQMGAAAGQDVGFELQHPRWLTTQALHGDGRRAIRECLRYLSRYGARHKGDWTTAALWKGGPGTASTVMRELPRRGKASALAHAEQVHRIPNLREYVRRFDEAALLYHRAAPAPLEEVQVEEVVVSAPEPVMQAPEGGVYDEVAKVCKPAPKAKRRKAGEA